MEKNSHSVDFAVKLQCICGTYLFFASSNVGEVLTAISIIMLGYKAIIKTLHYKSLNDLCLFHSENTFHKL